MPKIALVSNTPPPYRVPIFQRLGRMSEVDLQVMFCSEREPNRLWDLPLLDFNHIFLRERFATINGRYIHNNPDVIGRLKRFKPDVVITDGFNPTHLYAFGYALFKGVPHVAMTDGTDISEQGLSQAHKMMRRLVYARTRAFAPASLGGQRLYQSYGISTAHCFTSCLCIDNARFTPDDANQEKYFDFIFSGRIEEVKNPLFALQVAHETAKKLQRTVKIIFVGAGQQQAAVQNAAALIADRVEAHFHGFAEQQALPALYRSARLLLFPTLWDPWGVVANEACAAGLPVLASPQAGVAGELVRDGENGFVCALEIDLWAERATQLLTQPQVWRQFSLRSQNIVREYNYDNAAAGLLTACRHALHDDEPGRAIQHDPAAD